MRKLLLITSVKGLWPFPQALSYNLSKYDYDIDFLDYEEHTLVNYNTCVLKRKIKIPKYRKFYRWKLYNFWKYTRNFRYKLFFKKLSKNYDVTMIIYLDSKLNYIANEIADTSKKLIVYFAGSDFYKQNDFNLTLNKKILDIADVINFTNPYMRDDVVNYYGKYYEKTTVVSLGLTNLDIIKNIQNNKENFKPIIKSGKIIVTIGYSGDERHQHILFFDILKSLETDIKKNIFLVVPMTYGLNQDYLNKIIDTLNNINIDFQVITDMLSDNEISNLRICTDIFVNIRTTDQLSGSMLEHLYAGSVLLVGKWLPYKKLDDLNINYHKVGFDNLENTFLSVLNNIVQEKEKCKKNSEIIYNEFSWESRISDLLKIFETR